MAFTIDPISKKVTFHINQEIRFIDILDSFAWMDGLQDADDLNLAKDEELDIIRRFAQTYEDNVNFDWQPDDMDDTVVRVLDKMYDDDRDWVPFSHKSRRLINVTPKKTTKVTNVTPKTTSKRLELRKPVQLSPEEENFVLEEAATPEDLITKEEKENVKG